MNYTDALLETYISQKPNTQAEEQTAFDLFKKELVNGPKKTITYANGVTGEKNFGTFDLDNFHIAFDRAMEEAGIDLAAWFNDEGRFTAKNIYGQIKNLDRSLPFVKYLYDMWGVQYSWSNLLGFTKNVKERQAKAAALEKAAEAEDAKIKAEEAVLRQKQNKIEDEIKTEVTRYIASLSEWEQLEKSLPKDERKELAVAFWVYFSLDNVIQRTDKWGMKEKYTMPSTDITSITITFKGVVLAPNDAKNSAIKIDLDDLKQQDPKTIAKEIIDRVSKKESEIKDILVGFIRTARAANFLFNNYEVWKDRQEAKDNIIKFTGYSDEKSYLVYYNPTDKKYYKAFMRRFGEKLGLMLIDLENPADKANVFEPQFILVAARQDISEPAGRYNCYREEHWIDYYNISLPKNIREKLGIKEVPQEGANARAEIRVDRTTGNLAKYFDMYSDYFYYVDSSD